MTRLKAMRPYGTKALGQAKLTYFENLRQLLWHEIDNGLEAGGDYSADKEPTVAKWRYRELNRGNIWRGID